MTLERNDRSLTGLKFELINSKPSFLSNGHTTTVFHFLMNNPSHREMLTILVMSSRIVGSSVLKMSIGMTSSSQDLLLRELMTLKTSSSDMGANSLYLATGCNSLLSGKIASLPNIRKKGLSFECSFGKILYATQASGTTSSHSICGVICFEIQALRK